MPTPSPRPRIAIVDNAVDHRLYRPVEHWTAALGGGDPFRAIEGRLPDLARGYTHIVLTGSEASILEREGWAEREADLVRDAVAAGLVVLGSCWGHQMIAYALAGPQAVGRAARREIGWVSVPVLEENPVLGAPGEFWTFTCHRDEVRAARPEIRVLAATPSCPVQAFAWSDRPVWGIQPHPEIGPEEGARFVRDLAARGDITAAERDTALAAGIRDSGGIRGIAAAFLAARPVRP